MPIRLGKRRAPKGERGVILVEVLIGVLLVAIITAGVFGAVLTSHQMLERTDLRTQAAAGARQLSNLLGNYVAPVNPTAAGNAYLAPFAPGGCWNLQDPANLGVCPAGWALADSGGGIYDARFLLNGTFRTLYNAGLTYSVADQPDGTKRIGITVTWVEP